MNINETNSKWAQQQQQCDGKGKRARCHNLWGENNRGNWKWFKVRAKKKAKSDKTGEGGGKKRHSSQRENGMCWRWSLNWILRKTRVIVQSWCQLSFGVSRFVIQHYASKFVRMLRWIWFNQNTILSMPSPLHLISVFALSFNWLPLFFFSLFVYHFQLKSIPFVWHDNMQIRMGRKREKKAHLRL